MNLDYLFIYFNLYIRVNTYLPAPRTYYKFPSSRYAYGVHVRQMLMFRVNRLQVAHLGVCNLDNENEARVLIGT